MLSAHHEILTTNPNVYRVLATIAVIMYVLSSRFVAVIFSALVKYTSLKDTKGTPKSRTF